MEKSSLALLSLDYMLAQVDASKCTFWGYNGTEKYIQCESGCCESGCCIDHYIYQVWYFWVCLMLALTLCSFSGRWYYRYKFVHHRVVVGHIDGQMTSVIDSSNENATAGSLSRTTDILTCDALGQTESSRNQAVSVIAPPSYALAPPSYESLFLADHAYTTQAETEAISKQNMNGKIPNNGRLGSYVYTQDVSDHIIL